MSEELSGPSQAQAMLQRVSPEGRARAQREQRRRQQRALRVGGRVLAVAVAMAAALAAYDVLLGSLPAFLVASAVVVVFVAAIGFGLGSRDKAASSARLDATPLKALPATTAQWLEGQTAALPAPAASIADAIAAELGVMGPQIAQTHSDETATYAVRRLLAVELPSLIERHRSVPPALRGRVRQAGQSADDHLVKALGIIRDEISRMSEQLARGDLDALATQDRFLELKYQGEAMLGSEPGA